MIRTSLAGFVLCFASGCMFLPQVTREPEYHNPFPQLSKVAVAPFFNHSSEPTVDGRHFALDYAAELQSVPGFEVVPVGIVEQHMQAYGLTLSSPQEVRKLAQLLEVDAVVIGAVTEFTPYYPPRCGIQVEWYAANPYYHPIPAGYGLPWGMQESDQIPPPLVYQAQLALAREQMKTQEPAYRPIGPLAPIPEKPPGTGVKMPPAEASAGKDKEKGKDQGKPGLRPVSFYAQAATSAAAAPVAAAAAVPAAVGVAAAGAAHPQVGLPPDWPDPRGFTAPPPMTARPVGVESIEPVLRHTAMYNGADSDVTEALSTYVYYRDDARLGGWKSYLQRSDDFIRFSCHLHIAQMLTARGGGGQTRVVRRWPTDRYTTY